MAAFLSLGLILAGYGLLADPAIYAKHSLGHKVNLTWGIAFALFGTLMLWLTARAKKSGD